MTCSRNRHSASDGRQPAAGIRHSSLVTRHFLLCIAFAALAANAAERPVAPDGYPHLLWHDEFDGGPLDTGKWSRIPNPNETEALFAAQQQMESYEQFL